MAKDLKEEREARTSGEERSRQREQAASVKFESQRQLGTEKDPEGAPGAGGAGRDGERSGGAHRSRRNPGFSLGQAFAPGV